VKQVVDSEVPNSKSQVNNEVRLEQCIASVRNQKVSSLRRGYDDGIYTTVIVLALSFTGSVGAEPLEPRASLSP